MAAPFSTVELREVSVRYEDTTVLGPLDLDIAPEDRWVILGPNGSGKTTLIKVLSLYRYPTTGTVQVLGESWEPPMCESFARKLVLLRLLSGISSGPISRAWILS